jgi:hypothetical protein
MNGKALQREKSSLSKWSLRASVPVLGAMVAVVLMALAPVASAAAAGAVTSHAKVIIEDEFGVQGCAKDTSPHPSLNLITGAGRAYTKGQSKTCGASKGGNTQIGESIGYLELGASEGMKLAKAASTVNITWNISAATSDSASGKFVPSQCPWDNISGPSVTFFANGSVAAGYLNLSESYCEVFSLWELFSEPVVVDETTGVTSYGAGLFAYNQSGSEYENYTLDINYTSPSYWSSNISQHTVGNFSFGTGGSSQVNLGGSSLITGSWAKGDRLLIEAYVEVIAETEVYYSNHAHASVLFNGSTAGNHVDLKGITVS